MTPEVHRRSERRVPPQQVHPWLNRRVYDKLKAYTARTGTTDSAVLNAALEQYLDNSRDAALIIRRLDRLGRGVARAHRQNDTVAELVSAFIQIWFAHTSPIPAEQQKAAKQSANKRYTDMIEFIRRRIAGSRNVMVDLLGSEDLTELGPDNGAAQGRPVPATLPSDKGASDVFDGE